MKKIFCYLLIAALVLGTFAGCKQQNTPPTESTGASQTENTEAKQTQSTETTQTETTNTTQTEHTEVTQPDPTEETKNETENTNPYVYDMSHEVITTKHTQAYSDSRLTFTFPPEWDYSVVQEEDGRNYYFRDPVLGKQCQFSFGLTGSVYAKELSQDYYQDTYAWLYKDFIMDTFTKETIQGIPCTKMGYSYTEDGTKFTAVLYTNVVDGVRMYNFQFRYPADQAENYAPIFAAIMDSIRIKPTGKKDISALPLAEAYDLALRSYVATPQSYRDVGKLQPETKQIVEIDGQYYQSYVATNVDHRYIWISQAEFPDELYKNKATWDWYIVGSAQVYSMELLGQIDTSRK